MLWDVNLEIAQKSVAFVEVGVRLIEFLLKLAKFGSYCVNRSHVSVLCSLLFVSNGLDQSTRAAQPTSKG
jgi:hypothetical protein